MPKKYKLYAIPFFFGWFLPGRFQLAKYIGSDVMGGESKTQEY